MEQSSTLVAKACHELGIKNMAFGMHDAAFPASLPFDLGRGTPYSKASDEFLQFLNEQGFNVLQLGPQGKTSNINPSPYDSTLFAKNPLNLDWEQLWAEGLLSKHSWDSHLESVSSQNLVDYPKAFKWAHRLLETMLPNFLKKPPSEFQPFLARNEPWLRAMHLSKQEQAEQFLIHHQHQLFRDRALLRNLRVFGDVQIGMSKEDQHAFGHLLLPDFAMGAPPSRTHPLGQAWNYPLLHPELFLTPEGKKGPVLDWLRLRIVKTLSEYDGLRMDHPHGWVDPWVYEVNTFSPDLAVQHGARLFSSPQHPKLARFAIAAAQQLDPRVPPYADAWVRSLEEDQVTRYGLLFEEWVRHAQASGRELVCEVLSTLPYPLAQVMQRHHLGRFRVLQKADPHNPNDVYRPHNAQPEDWVMLGNHDTPSIWQVLDAWKKTGLDVTWAEALSNSLEPTPHLRASFAQQLLKHRGLLVHALLAEAMQSQASNIFIFFTDFFGMHQTYNRPGTFSKDNWALRVPQDFRQRFLEKLPRLEIVSLRHGLAMALHARNLAPELEKKLLEEQHFSTRGQLVIPSEIPEGT